METRLVSSIKIGKRFRKDLGDIESLAKNIEEIGLLHPIVIDSQGNLIVGRRRLEAFKVLKRQEIPVTILDVKSILEAEASENIQRLDLSPSEAVEIAKVLLPVAKAKAKERMRSQDYGRGVTPKKFKGVTGEALVGVAQAVGMSQPTLKKAMEVVEAAEKHPLIYQPLVKEMDKTGKIDGVYKKLRGIGVKKPKDEEKLSIEGLPAELTKCTEKLWLAFRLAEAGKLPSRDSQRISRLLDEICRIRTRLLEVPEQRGKLGDDF